MAITGTSGTITISASPPVGGGGLPLSLSAIATGGGIPYYTITLADAFGNPLLRLIDWVSVEWAWVEMNVGSLTLVLPGYIPETVIAINRGMVVVERGLGSAPPALLNGTIYLRTAWDKQWRRTENGFEKVWVITCQDLNLCLEDRYVDYNAGSSYTSKLDEADNMLKAVVRENHGSLALDTTRSITSILDVEADVSAAPIVRKSFSRRKVLPVLQEIAKASFQRGTYVSFDVVCKTQPGAGSAFKAEFRTYTGQRGMDHRVPGGNPPILIGPDFGNLDDPRLSYDAREAATRAIVGGDGEEELRAVARENDLARQYETPWGPIEHFEDSRQEGDATALQDEARSLIKLMRPRRTLSGEIVQTAGLIYGLNFGRGDYVTAQMDGMAFDARLSALKGSKNRDGPEQLEAIFMAES